jgi:VWFA-related protein
MKKTSILAIILLFPSMAGFQEIQHETSVVNVEVPIRVYDKGVFVNDLKINDLEVFEDGVPQKIEALYLIEQSAIKRLEENKRFKPETSRHFYIFFEITEYSPELERALNYFFLDVYTPEDFLTVVTPRKTYRLKRESLKKIPKEKIIEQIKAILHRDAWMANAEYRSIITELIHAVKLYSTAEDYPVSLEASDDSDGNLLSWDKYEILRDELESLRKIDEKRLFDFARHLKNKEGQKNVFIFYQREFIPEFEQNVFNKMMDNNVVIQQLKINDYLGFFPRDIAFNVERIKQAYADSSITINFLFFSKPSDHVHGVKMAEHVEDYFSAFNEMSKATGGISVSSANPDFLFRRAGDASQNYYLFYYTPKNYRADGKFKSIKVKLKANRNGCEITHRSGYFAN